MLVGWLFLALSLYGALYTLNAFAPLRRGRVLYAWSFVSSWLTTEGALFHVAWQVVVSGVFVWLGALGSWPGRVGLVVCLASWTGLLVLFGQSRRAGRAIEASLGELTPGASAVRYRRRDVRLHRNVEYRRAGGHRLRMDILEPAAPRRAGERRPALVQIHGGAWILGFKDRQALPLMHLMAANGWVVFNIDYRLSPTATWPDHLVDCKAAVAWVREHADDYGVDASFVAVTGGSAGGHLSALMALTANDPRYQPGFEAADTSVQAAVPFYGVYDWTNSSGAFPEEFHRWILEPLVVKEFLDDDPQRFADASPLVLVRAAVASGRPVAAPPMLVVHGTRDTLAPVVDARTFTTELAAASDNEVLYVELPGAQHAFDTFRSPRTNRMVQGVHRFLAAIHARHEAVAPDESAPGPTPDPTPNRTPVR